MLNSRGFRCAVFLALVACGGAKPEPKLDDMPQQKMELAPVASNADLGDLAPALVTPTVQESQVADELDIFDAPDSATLIASVGCMPSFGSKTSTPRPLAHFTCR